MTANAVLELHWIGPGQVRTDLRAYAELATAGPVEVLSRQAFYNFVANKYKCDLAIRFEGSYAIQRQDKRLHPTFWNLMCCASPEGHIEETCFSGGSDLGVFLNSGYQSMDWLHMGLALSLFYIPNCLHLCCLVPRWGRLCPSLLEATGCVVRPYWHSRVLSSLVSLMAYSGRLLW